MRSIFKFLLFSIFGYAIALQANSNSPQLIIEGNQLFRNQVIEFTKDLARHEIYKTARPSFSLSKIWEDRTQQSDWDVELDLYLRGQKICQKKAIGLHLDNVFSIIVSDCLKQANLRNISEHEFNQLRFLVQFYYYPNQKYAFIEYEEKGLELTGTRVAVRNITKASLQEQLDNSQHYLVTAMDKKYHGFYKLYYAASDTAQRKLRTVYTASSLYTLTKLYSSNHDQNLFNLFKPIAHFLLSLQLKSGSNAGAFYYSLDPKTEEKQPNLVVGTTSKTIFALLELYKLTKEDQYLSAAKKGGDWLLTRIKSDGKVIPITTLVQGSWQMDEAQSFLYSGQVLSALSRLYALTHDSRYYQGAAAIAQHFKIEVQRQGLLLGDAYRSKNSISTSWVLMSFIDYAHINPDKSYHELIQQLANKLLSLQIKDNQDLFTYGRYRDTRKASGNGWINEVMGQVYQFCLTEQLGNCKPYQQSMILSSRWLIQNSYSKTNNYDVKNSNKALGGFIGYFLFKTVRTDAVCHGINGLLSLLQSIDGKKATPLLSIKERPFEELLPSLRAGHGFYQG